MAGDGLRIGIADHLGWAIAVTANDRHQVVDRRRIELVGAGLNPMPVHHHDDGLEDAALAALIAEVRASALRTTRSELGDLATSLGAPVRSLSLRVVAADFPTDLPTLRRSPWEARADAVMYRQVLTEVARDRRWDVAAYEAKTVVGEAEAALGDRAEEILRGPRARLGPPWTKDHVTALASTVVLG